MDVIAKLVNDKQMPEIIHEALVWLQQCTFSHISHYHSVKLTSMASVDIAFPRQACESADLISIGHLLT
jgi:hypothetical protein